MTISEAYLQLKNDLCKIYDDKEAINIANLILENISGLSKIDRRLNKELVLNKEQLKTFERYTKELINHKPVQYVLNEAWFAGIKFYVDESVLIPRPETEELVEWIVDDVKSFNKNPVNILDVGTGSGCIAIALKRKLNNSNVSAIDISEDALSTAQKNANENNATVSFLKADILQKETLTNYSKFDVIVSNPPYITEKEMQAMHKNVIAYEPHIALFVPNDNPLLFYDRISESALHHLTQNGVLYFEINEDFSNEIVNLLNDKGFHSIQLKKDLQRKNRMVKAVYNAI